MAKRRKPKDNEGASRPDAAVDARRARHEEFRNRVLMLGDPVSFLESNWSRENEEEAKYFESSLDEILENYRWMESALLRYAWHEVMTLDEAFGVSRPDGYRMAAARRELESKADLIRDVYRFCDAGAVRDDDLFEVVGKIHGCGKTLAKEWWRERPKHRGFGRKPGPAITTPRELPKDLLPYRDEVKWRRKR